MKTHPLPSTIILILGLGGLTAHAQVNGEARPRQFYLHGGIGGGVMEDLALEEFVFLGPLSGVTLEMDPGFRLDIGGGYQATEWLGFEFETGVSIYTIDSVTGTQNIDFNDSSISNWPLLANVVFKWPTRIGLVPYVGGGGGGVVSTFFADDVGVITPSGFGFIDGAESELTWAVDAFAGVRYELNRNVSVGVAYKFMQTGGPSWDVDDDFFFSVGDIEVDEMQTHTVELTFQMRF